MIHYDMPMDEYHANDAISNSKGKVFAEHGPQRFFRQYIAKDLPGEDSPAFAFGRAFDDRLFLSDATFADAYCRKPAGMNFATKEGKEWKAANESRTIISDDDWIMMEEMFLAIHRNPIARDLLAIGEAQVSIRAELPELGIVAQSRPDWLRLTNTPGICDGPCIVDLKTCADLNAFDRNAISFGYNRQLALGQALLAKEGIIAQAFLLVVEKKMAPRCRVRVLPEYALAAGWNQFCQIGAQIGGRLKSGNWEDSQTEIEVIRVSPWDEKQLTMEASV